MAYSPQRDPAQIAYDVWAKDRSKDSMSVLLRQLDPLVERVASSQGVGGDNNVKWAARAFLARQIMERYDPKKSSLSTFTYQTLQRIPRIAAKQRNVVNVPESSDTDMRYLRKVKAELYDELDRDPTDEELADRSGVGLDRVRNLTRRFSRPIMTESHLSSLGVPIPGAAQAGKSSDQMLWEDIVMEGLDPTDAKIHKWLSSNKPLSKVQIAGKLGMSPSAVTQRVTRLGKELGSYGG